MRALRRLYIIPPVVLAIWLTVATLYGQTATPSLIDLSEETYLPLSVIPRDYAWTPPPESDRATEGIIHEKTRRILAAQAKKIKLATVPEFRLADIRAWATYVNFDHFVPLTAEGVPEQHGFNFNYYPGKNPKGLPIAEITETGEFVLWWQYLNYSNAPPGAHDRILEAVVSHELHHFRQWQELAMAAMKAVGQEGPPPKTRRDLGEQAFARFMARWTDIDHYRGRELEVYIRQIKDRELPPQLVFAPHIQAYYEGVRQSRWKDEFQEQLRYVEYLMSQTRNSLNN